MRPRHWLVDEFADHRAPVRSVRDIDAAMNQFKDLFFFHLIEQGIYIARRGYVVLSLPVGDAETARFEAALASFIERYVTPAAARRQFGSLAR